MNTNRAGSKLPRLGSFTFGVLGSFASSRWIRGADWLLDNFFRRVICDFTGRLDFHDLSIFVGSSVIGAIDPSLVEQDHYESMTS